MRDSSASLPVLDGKVAGIRRPLRSRMRVSSPDVVASESWLSKPVSRPSAIAPTPASTATPAVRRTQSPTGRERFRSPISRPPKSNASAREVPAPAA